MLTGPRVTETSEANISNMASRLAPIAKEVVTPASLSRHIDWSGATRKLKDLPLIFAGGPRSVSHRQALPGSRPLWCEERSTNRVRQVSWLTGV